MMTEGFRVMTEAVCNPADQTRDARRYRSRFSAQVEAFTM